MLTARVNWLSHEALPDCGFALTASTNFIIAATSDKFNLCFKDNICAGNSATLTCMMISHRES